MVTLKDPTEAFAGIVANRRAERAAIDGERFRLGAETMQSSDRSDGWPLVLIGASAWALTTGQVEHTLQTIGRIGGALTDWGCEVRPIGSAGSQGGSPAFVVWVSGDETRTDECDELRRFDASGVSVGSPVSELTDWVSIDDVAPIGDRRFERQLLSAVAEIAPDVVECLPDLLPDSPGTGGTGGDEPAQPNAENPATARGNGIWRHRPERGSSNS